MYPGFSLYHATKWGIEGFLEAVAKEVASFGIAFMLVEPGPTGTNFGASLVRSQPMKVYGDPSVGKSRHAQATGEFKVTSDADKMVDDRCCGQQRSGVAARQHRLWLDPKGIERRARGP